MEKEELEGHQARLLYSIEVVLNSQMASGRGKGGGQGLESDLEPFLDHVATERVVRSWAAQRARQEAPYARAAYSCEEERHSEQTGRNFIFETHTGTTAKNEVNLPAVEVN